MLTKQVADYFEVPLQTLHSCYLRNKEEIDLDGILVKGIRDLDVCIMHTSKINTKGVTTFVFEDKTTLDVANRGARCFSQRAILRIAMLLNQSIIAREIRNQV